MRTVTVLLAVFCAAACGDSDSSTCEKAGRLLCERACECGQGRCVMVLPSSATISFDTEAQCTALYVDLGCAQGGNPQIDHQACYDALQTAPCAGTTPDGVLLPAACNEQN